MERPKSRIAKAAERKISAYLPLIQRVRRASLQQFEKAREIAISAGYESALIPARKIASKMTYLIINEGRYDLREKAAKSIAESAAAVTFDGLVNPKPKIVPTVRVQINLAIKVNPIPE